MTTMNDKLQEFHSIYDTLKNNLRHTRNILKTCETFINLTHEKELADRIIRVVSSSVPEHTLVGKNPVNICEWYGVHSHLTNKERDLLSIYQAKIKKYNQLERAYDTALHQVKEYIDMFVSRKMYVLPLETILNPRLVASMNNHEIYQLNDLFHIFKTTTRQSFHAFLKRCNFGPCSTKTTFLCMRSLKKINAYKNKYLK